MISQSRLTRRAMLAAGALGGVLGLTPRAASAYATIASARSGPWDDPATWVGGIVPGPGVSAVVSPGHAVTIRAGRPVVIGPDTPGGVAVRLRQPGATLAVQADLTLRGHLDVERGATLAVAAPPAGGLRVRFDPAPGNQHSIRQVNVGTGVSALRATGTAASRVRFETTARGGANGQVLLGPYPSACALAHVTLQRLGTSSQDALSVRTQAASSAVAWTNVRAVGCGRLSLNCDASGVLDVNGLDLRGPAGGTGLTVQAWAARATGGVRKLQRLTSYATTRKTINIYARDLDLCRTIRAVNTTIANNGDRRNVLEDVWFLSEVSGAYLSVSPNGSNVIRQSAFVTRQDNPHTIQEVGGLAGLGPTLVEDCVFDGDGFVGSDAGDCIMPRGDLVAQRNVFLNKAGTIASMILSTGSITALRNTAHDAFHLALGETFGHAGQCDAFRNNLVVGQQYAVRQWAAFVRQAEFVYDYNVTFGLSGSGRIAGRGLRLPSARQVGGVACTAGTGSSTVVAAGATFVTSGVIAGDYFTNEALGKSARVARVDGETRLTLAEPIAGQAAGQAGRVDRSYWAQPGAAYGQEGRGAHDFSVDPMFRDPRRTARAFDLARGGPGTLAHLGGEIVKLNGCDADGRDAAFDARYTLPAFLSYIRDGFTPTNPALKGAGHPADGAPDIGAVPVLA